jgi:hypothetical protein
MAAGTQRAGSGDSLTNLPKLQPVHRLAKPDLKIVQRIGEGAFGEVSVAKAPLYGTVAVKWLKVRFCGGPVLGLCCLGCSKLCAAWVVQVQAATQALSQQHSTC